MGKYMKSWNGYEVVDEKARKDIEKLDINTNIHLDNIEEKYDESLLTKLTAPQTAKVGQIFRVQEVNEDGTLTLEAVDMPECDVTDVQIAGTSIVGEDRVAEIPAANNNSFGAVKANPNWMGLSINNGIIGLFNSENEKAWIDDRIEQSLKGRLYPINITNFDYTLKAAMCDGKGEAWTSDEQAAARARLGIYNKFQLVNEIVTEEEISQLVINTTDSGDIYNFSDVEIILNLPAVSPFGLNIHFTEKEHHYPVIYRTLGNASYETFYRIRTLNNGCNMMFAILSYHTNSPNNSSVSDITTSSIYPRNFDGRIKTITLSTGGTIPVGTKINIWGKR